MSSAELGPSSSLAPPLYPSSVYVLPDLDALDAVYGGAPGFIYARDGHPNAAQLAAELTKLHAGAWGVVTGSGMGAITAGLLGFVSSGDRVLASNRLYGKTTKLLRSELARFGVRTDFVDVSDLDAVRAAGPAKVLVVETISNPLCRVSDLPALAEIAHRTGAKLFVDNTFADTGSLSAPVLIVETISNPLCRVSDLPALAEIAHRTGAKLFVDNTFATPVLCRPLEFGADLVMESLTKLIGGHSDVTLGFLAGADTMLGPTVSSLVSTWGLSANPFDCWLTLRGLETLDLRARAATANAAALAAWLAEQPGVTRVIYPSRPDHPDHALARRLLPTGCGHMLCFELAGGRDTVNRFMRRAPGIPFSPSLGHTRTTCSHPDTTSHRYEAISDKRAQGITEGLIRLSVGCEPIEVARAELAKGLS